VLTLTPPLVTTREQMDRALDIVDECLADEARA
jgi:4-aminobutyrate aminotransferase-like enzyme